MTTTNNYGLAPFKLRPHFAERVWGRTSLAPWFEVPTPGTKFGEVWLTGPECVIDAGEEAGRTLGDLSAQCIGTLGDGDFPLLVKMLFPDEKLSVQVHPNDEQAQAAGHARGKTECWYVLEALPGAAVACGLRAGVGAAELAAAAADGSMENLLERIPVAVGDMILVDAGTVHAIGPGVTLLEVQQTSDITYRLFDYGRGRDLHLAEGLKVVKAKTAAGKVAPKTNDDSTRLIATDYFVVDRFDVPAGSAFEMAIDGVGCVVGLSGQGAVNAVRFRAGEAVVIPTGSVTMSSSAGCSFVRCFVPED